VRQAHGMTQGELSRQSGIDQAQISRVENGKELPSLRYLLRVGKALGIRDLVALERFRSE
jgi:transcriptional regulator with XRE-family HTH domain